MLRTKYTEWRSSIEWFFVNTILSQFPSRRFRYFCLRILGAKIGRAAMFGGFEIRNPAGLVIEDGCSIGPRARLDARMGLHLEKNVVIACEAMIWTLHHDYNDPCFRAVGAPVKIEEYAWICSRAIIMPGVKIGKAAVVASGAVLTHDVEPYAIVGGIPAKVIGMREKHDYHYVPSNYIQHLT